MKVRSSIIGLVALTAIGALGGCAGTWCLSHGDWKLCHTNVNSIGISQPTSTLGISQRVLNSPYGTAAKLVVSVSAVAPEASMLQYFNPSELTVQVDMQGGHLAGATGIARLNVLDTAGKVVATKDVPYGIGGNTLYLQNPGAIKNWLTTQGPALIKKGANGIYVSANLPMIRNPNSPAVSVKTTIYYNGTSIGSATGSFKGLHIVTHPTCRPGTIVGTHSRCRVQ